MARRESIHIAEPSWLGVCRWTVCWAENAFRPGWPGYVVGGMAARAAHSLRPLQAAFRGLGSSRRGGTPYNVVSSAPWIRLEWPVPPHGGPSQAKTVYGTSRPHLGVDASPSRKVCYDEAHPRRRDDSERRGAGRAGGSSLVWSRLGASAGGRSAWRRPCRRAGGPIADGNHGARSRGSLYREESHR